MQPEVVIISFRCIFLLLDNGYEGKDVFYWLNTS